jgi:hypothetical protein
VSTIRDNCVLDFLAGVAARQSVGEIVHAVPQYPADVVRVAVRRLVQKKKVKPDGAFYKAAAKE